MTRSAICRHRLINQQLENAHCKTPGELVSWMGAIQAQDYEMAKWAIGIRVSASPGEVENAINRGEIIRTHILRPTWHFVSPGDIRWLLRLSAPGLRAYMAPYWRKMELDEKIFKRSNKIILQALSGNKSLSREELLNKLRDKGIDPGNPMRSAHFMLRAELEGLICNGPKRGKTFTYVLLEEKAGLGKTMPQEEALATLANRYFSSHGCATLQDFCWWSGLGVREAKTGLELIKNGLDSADFEKKTYWFRPAAFSGNQSDSVHFLPAFDEYLISYKDRSASLDSGMMNRVITSNGIFKPLILFNGQVAGIWKKDSLKNQLLLQPMMRGFKNILPKQVLREAADRYALYLGTKIRLV